MNRYLIDYCVVTHRQKPSPVLLSSLSSFAQALVAARPTLQSMFSSSITAVQCAPQSKSRNAQLRVWRYVLCWSEDKRVA
jgi:hypothetical protein